MKKIVPFILTLCMTAGSCVIARADGYIDMQNHWANRFVAMLSDMDIISGEGDGNFRPEEAVGADEFIKLVLTAMGENMPNARPYWAQNYINRALELGWIEQNELGDYALPINRFAMSKILVRALNLELSATADTQAVIQRIPDYYDILNADKEYVLLVCANGLISGYEDGSFKGYETVTRAQSAVIISRLLKFKPQEETQIPNTPVQNAFYVAAEGNDQNSGTIEAPFQTIEKARDAIRLMRNGGALPEGGVTVYLRGGEYTVTKSIVFEQQDSGMESAPITYTSYPGETARLSGGKKLAYQDFKPVDTAMSAKLISKNAKDKVVQIDLKAAGIDNMGEIVRRGFLVSDAKPAPMALFIGGDSMTLSRWPNDGFVGVGDTVRTAERKKDEMSKGAVYKYDYDEPAKWKFDVQNIFVSGVLGMNYAYDYYPIGKIDASAKEITLREGATKSYYSKPFVYYENIFEEMDMPGEYYIDRTNGILYLYPPQNLNKESDIRVSTLEDTMVSLEGTSYFTLKNIQMDTMRGRCVVSKNKTQNITIENCDIRGVGWSAITLNQTTNSAIRNSHIYDIGYTGVSIGGGDYENLISGNNVVENNHIHKIAQLERSYQTAVMLGYRSVGTIVRNNEIHDTPHAAIIIYGPEHIVEYNNIYDTVRDFHDMDAIYMNVYVYPWERGVTIRQNYIHDFGQRMFTDKQMNVAAIRSDNNGNGLNVEENIFYNIGFEGANQIRGVCLEGTRNVIRNNIFVDTAEAYDGPSTYNPEAKFDLSNAALKTAYNDFQKYVGVYSKKYPEITNFWNEHFGSFKQSNIFDNNLIVNIKFPMSTLNGPQNQQGFRAAQELVSAKGNLITDKDPGFENYAGKNFTLKSDSAVYGKIPGFKTIAFDKMGIAPNVTVGVYK